ncbi:DgyrCDS1412 [Dimorphilus gyrociliatus]|uniref:DgyrCDS1412 n=1 Tax=Dimorphilus gyrociliatus TaxID=2664684 RepID=A0A7I8V7G3_9ANNE|nr:DgyrCDS1412 [Dimorphilus gyrociliatus]
MTNSYCNRMKLEIASKTFWRDIFAEFLATFLLLACICAISLNFEKDTKSTPLECGLIVGLAVAFLVESFGHLGGAHLNPAVTFSFVLFKNITILKGICYTFSQCMGAVAGSFFIRFMTPIEKIGNLGATVPAVDVPTWKALIVEMWVTGQLVFVILASTDDHRRKVRMPALPVGFSVTVGILTGWNYSGGSLNPARTLGPAVVRGIWESHWIYWLGPIGGSGLATVFYRFLLRKAVNTPEVDESGMRSNIPEIEPLKRDLNKSELDD